MEGITLKPRNVLEGNLDDLQLDDEELQNIVPSKQSNIVKIRFTSKQYNLFINACTTFHAISQNPDFYDFVRSSLSGRGDKQTINKQLITPIVDAPKKLYVGKKSRTKVDQEKSINSIYFIRPTPMTSSCKKLYNKVKNSIDKSLLRHDNTSTTCFTDVRAMLREYISSNNLKDDLGNTKIDTFLQGLGNNTVEKHNNTLIYDGDSYFLPKGDRKIIMSLADEILK